MAVVCVPGITIAGDAYTQSENYLYVATRSGDAATEVAEATESLRWNSTGNDSARWDTDQNAVWVDESTGQETSFKAGSNVQFGEGTDLHKEVQIAPERVEASSVEIIGSDYQFSGGDMIVTDRLSVAESASIDSALIIGSTTTPLTIDVAEGKTFTIGMLGTYLTDVNGTHIHAQGAFTKTGEGTLSVTDGMHGLFSAATIQDGKLVLGDGVALEVGANEFLGGTLENVDMHISADIYRPVTGGIVTAHNLIRSADGVNAAVLTDVALHAGTATEYATLQNVVFAGKNGSLTGFITYEETQAQREMGVATGGKLAVNNVTFDLHGLSSGEKVLIENAAVSDAAEHLKGELTGWETVKFVYSGIAVNSAAVNSAVVGMVTIDYDHDGNLYWTGAADDKWNPSSANWSLAAGETGKEVFTALSNVYFGSDNVGHQDIIVSQDVVAMNLSITGGGYSFSGARVATLGDALISPTAGTVTFNDQLVIQGNLTTSGEGTVELLGSTTVVKDMTLNSAHTTLAGDVTVLGEFTVNAGTSTTAGRLDINGNVTAKEMNIAVSAGEDVGTSYHDALVNVTGDLSATGDLSVGEPGNITIGGTAEQHYLGVVKADNLTVNTLEHDVFFDNLHVGSLTVGKGAHVHVQTSSAAVSVSSSVLPDIYLSGTLALDAYGTTYDQGYNVYVQDDAAALSFGTGCTISGIKIYGKVDNSGDSIYTDLSIAARSRSATVELMKDLGSLQVGRGSLTVKNAGDAVHGALSLDNGRLNLAENSDDFMADGSGAISLVKGSRLNIGLTTQNLSAKNKISLYGASSITGETGGRGLVFADGAGISYKDADNAIMANMVVEHALNIHSEQSGSSLTISGALSGSGDVQLSGAGTVAFSGVNSFAGDVTVGQDSTLSLQNPVALSQAGVILSSGGTLSLDTDTMAKLDTLEFSSGSTLAFSTIYDTDEFSVDHAALHVAGGAIGSGTLNISFAGELDTMRTYNLMTGLTSSSFENLTLNVTHNGGVALDASQYKLGFDAESGLLYMYTLMGNVWESSYGGGWSTDQNDTYYKCWSGGSYYDQNADYPDAIFGDLSNKGPIKIDVDGVVSPGNVHFVADTTEYDFYDQEGWPIGQLAAGTNIHKDGNGKVTLGLRGNQDASAALGDIDIQLGELELSRSLAVGGKVTVAQDAEFSVPNRTITSDDVLLKMGAKSDGSVAYTVSGIKYTDLQMFDEIATATLSGVTMDADGIRGEENARGSASKLLVRGDANLSYLTLTDFETEGNKNGNVTLSHVTLTSSDGGDSQITGYYRLEGVTIGKDVVVDEDGFYSLTGKIAFEDTLVNKGKVMMTNVTAEIGKVNYSFTVDESGKSEYIYQFIRSERADGYDLMGYKKFESRQVSINGVNLATGLADGVVADFTDNEDGSFTLSIGNETADGTSDGTVGMPQWDERWDKEASSPAISRRYAGTDPTANLVMAAGKDGDTSYYLYNSIVNEENAAKVNNGKAIVVTLSSAATGNVAVAGDIKNSYYGALDHEVWIYDRSGFKTVIAGQGDWSDNPQAGATHLLVNSVYDGDGDRVTDVKDLVVGGSRWCGQKAESFVTIRNGNISRLVGGSYESWTTPQTGTAHVFVDNGTIGTIYAAGYKSDMRVKDGELASELELTGGTIGGAFGGGFGPTVSVTGDIYVRMNGAQVTGQLVGGSDGSTVTGDIVMDLISGSAAKVHAAGLGWNDGSNNSIINGDVLVNLYSDFQLGKESEVGALYGGKEKVGSFVSFGKGYTSTLHFAEAGEYTLGTIKDDGYTASDDSVIVTGFDRITLAEGAHAVVALGKFDVDMDASTALNISGKGVVEVIGHGKNFGRDILLTNGATLKVATSVIGLPDDVSDDRTIMVTEGSTLDITGFPVESDYAQDKPYAGLGFKTEICGDGVDNMGAIYKGAVREAVEGNDLSVNKVSLPSVTLTGSASAKVMDNEVLHMNSYGLKETSLDLNNHTFTKKGMGTMVARNVQMTEGTMLVHEGDIYVDKESRGADTDMVMAAGTALYLNSTNVEGKHSLSLSTLSGTGSVTLNAAELTLHTSDASVYEADYMDETQSYNQFMSTTGFAHAVFSGTIIDGNDGDGRIGKTGKGVHYISGSANTYSGGTSIYDGRLYLLGTSVQSVFDMGDSSVVSGVAGTGAIIWAGKNAELYLGHDARIYNDGTTNVQGGVMTIGVEGAPNGVLADFVGIHSKDKNGALRYVTMDGKEYVEIETHNLSAITVKAKYADKTDYVAGSEIDRNKMLLVEKSDWESVKNTAVIGFSDTGYNEAIYSGVLRDSNGVAAKLHKVGVGTLVLDQSSKDDNAYSGGTLISAGTLRVRGWGTLGKNVKENAAIVEGGATLMFTHNGGYGNEPTRADNNEPTRAYNDIIINGSGDARWVGQAATDGDTAALISAVGPAVTFTLSGDISGSGNVRHSGEGVLVLSGDNSYTGGTYASRGTVEVQSATGFGATATGQGAVTIEADADLRVTVGAEHTEPSMVTTLASEKNDIKGDVLIKGTDTTERVLHMGSNGYDAATTTLSSNGTLLLNGEGVSAHTSVLTGSGTVAVSDATGAGSVVSVDSVIDYIGDFRVEGDNASVNVSTGSYIDGSIHVAGQQASVHIGGGISIADGEMLKLMSTGDAFAAGGSTAAQVSSEGAVSVSAGAVLSVGNQETKYEYNLMGLEIESRIALADVAPMESQDLPGETVFTAVGSASWKYDGVFDQGIAINQQAAGVIIADGGLTLAGGATYETVNSHVNLMGSGLTLNTMENSLIAFNTVSAVTLDASSGDVQLVLFSDVGSVYFALDDELAGADSGVYYTQANRYLTGFDGITEDTLLVYDSNARVVYLHTKTIPEPATTTLNLLALAALAARRRRK